MNLNTTPAVWLSEPEIRTLVQNARRAKASLVALIAGIDEKVAQRRDVLNKSLNDLDVKDRLRAVDASASTLKATLKQETSKQRTDILREIARLNDQAKGAIQFWDNPVAIVLRETIASAKRATIYDNLASAGPVELKGFASLSVAAKDKDMAAAVISRLHAIQPASGRPVSPRAVANELVGELQKEMHAGLLEVDSVMQEAILVERLFVSGRSGSNGVASVALALKHRRDAEVGGKRVEDEADDV